MTKGASTPLKRVDRKRRPVIIESIIPNKYIPNITDPARAPKKAPARTMYTGSLAEHDIKGVMRIVRIRSFSLSKVRLAIMAGTLHPNPMSMGMNDLP